MKRKILKGLANSDTKYEKTQMGWLMIVIFTLILIHITLAYLFAIGDRPLSFNAYSILMTVFLVTLLLLYRLTITVDSTCIRIAYGIGVVHIKIRPEKIHSVEVVKVPWIYGLGIRFTPKGMLYSIQGRDAVKISYFDGKEKRVLIGSKDPESLKVVLDEVFSVEANIP